MWVNWIQLVQRPTSCNPRRSRGTCCSVHKLNLKANFETRISHFGFKVWVTRRFQAVGQLHSACAAPHLAELPVVLGAER
jgi:hypothetical protein